MNISAYSSHNYTINDILVFNSQLIILTSNSLLFYNINKFSLELCKTTKVNSSYKNALIIDNTLALVDDQNKLNKKFATTASGTKKVNNSITYLTLNNQFLCHFKNELFTLFNIPANNYYVSNISNVKNILTICSYNLLTKCLTSKQLNFHFDSKSKSFTFETIYSNTFSLTSLKCPSVLKPIDNHSILIVDSNKIYLFHMSSNTLSVLKSLSTKSTILSISVHHNKSILLITTSLNEIWLLKFSNDFSRCINSTSVQTDTIFTNLIFYHKNSFLTYNKSHIPIKWLIKESSLINSGPILNVNNKSNLFTGISSIFNTGDETNNKNIIVKTDGFNSFILSLLNLKFNSLLNLNSNLKFVGLIHQNRFIVLKLIDPGIYQIINLSTNKLIHQFSLSDLNLNLDSKDSISFINDYYIVFSEPKIILNYNFDILEGVVKLDILGKYYFDLFKLSNSMLVLYHCNRLSIYDNGEVVESFESFNFNDQLRLSLNVIWSSNLFILINNPYLFYSVSWDGNSFKVNCFSLNLVLSNIVGLLPYHDDIILINDRFENYSLNQLSLLPINELSSLSFMKILFIKGINKLICLTLNNELHLLENNQLFNLSHLFKLPKIVDIFHFNDIILIKALNNHLIALDFALFPYISDKIGDVVVRSFVHSKSVLLIGLKSIHLFSLLNGQVKTINLTQDIVNYGCFENTSIYALLLHIHGIYSVYWFCVEDSALIELKSNPKFSSNHFIPIDFGNKIICIDKQYYKVWFDLSSETVTLIEESTPKSFENKFVYSRLKLDCFIDRNDKAKVNILSIDDNFLIDSEFLAWNVNISTQ